jgi:hypothetical protein
MVDTAAVRRALASIGFKAIENAVGEWASKPPHAAPIATPAPANNVANDVV